MRYRLTALRRLAARQAIGLRSRLWRAGHRTGYQQGLLSVVVPVWGVEKYLGRCLDSLRAGAYRNLEIVVVDDGSPDGSAAVARGRRWRDPRIRLIRRPNGGLSAARNTGIRAARGEFLAFLDGDDFVDQGAYAAAIRSLHKTGSDFAVLPYRRWRAGAAHHPAPWIRAAHRRGRARLTLSEAPWVLVDAVAWNKVYRREFWQRQGLSFPPGLLYEDQAVSMTVFAAARRFDVLAGPGVMWRLRDDRSSITDDKAHVRNLADQERAARDSLDVLARLSTPDVRRERLRQLLNNNLSGFIEHIPDMAPAAWAAFRSLCRYLADEADRDDTGGIWGGVEARKKIVVALARADRCDLAEAFLAAGGWAAANPAAPPEVAAACDERMLRPGHPPAVPA
ncbi:MAG TPA: glycosyltransferase family 2 protein [Microbacteriaceae bacterium]|nr:glycosyltransferase family 2 protein [Microbacteriaceae bacterium]